ncbi:UNVERIFIED_CONTAM: hypothetical protein FKN15_076315 [Acipenser sinensis]
MNTRCPPKRVPSAARFFALCRLTVQLPQSYSVGGRRSSGQLTGKPAGARPDYSGRWCVVSRGDPGRPNPPSPRMTLGQLSAAPWELPSTVGCGIAWTRTGDVQTIERILHSSDCFYWMRHSGAQYYGFLVVTESCKGLKLHVVQFAEIHVIRNAETVCDWRRNKDKLKIDKEKRDDRRNVFMARCRKHFV